MSTNLALFLLSRYREVFKLDKCELHSVAFLRNITLCNAQNTASKILKIILNPRVLNAFAH